MRFQQKPTLRSIGLPTDPLLVISCLVAGLISAAGVCAVGADSEKNHQSSFPPIEEVRQGMVWPRGQALPTFAPPSPVLDSLEVQSLTGDEQLTFSALQGQVNRTRPRIYLLDARSDAGRDTWANTPSVGLGETNLFDRDSKYDLVAKYSPEIKGLVLYTTKLSPHYRNLAATVAALRQALPVTAEVQQHLRQNGVDLPVVADLTNLQFSSSTEIYEYLHDRYWPGCEKRVIVSARPHDRGGDLHHTRDLAAACGAAMVWLDSRIPAERDVMRKFFGDMEAGNAVALGWYATERSGITTASEFGIGTLPADHYISATVYSGTGHRIRVPAVPKMPELHNKAYVAIFISDGDNIQYAQRAMRWIWDASAASRGKVPLNWTIAPGLVDIGPGILNYYFSTSTPQDCFVAGPSGMGYLIPFNTLAEPGAPVGIYLDDPERMQDYAALTETYLQRSGLRVVTIWDDATPMQRAAYEQHCRSLYGATVQNFRDVPSVRGSVIDRRVRFDKLVIPYVETYEHISRSLKSRLDVWNGDSPLFLTYQVNVWGEMKPDRIVDLARQLTEEYAGRVEFVRADHYFNLYNEAHELSFNVCMSPAVTVSDSESADASRVVIDGTPATLWTASGKSSRWLRFDLGKPYEIRRYVIRHAGASGVERKCNAKNFTLQASSDGESWRLVHRCEDNAEDVTDVDLQPFTARYLKLLIEDEDSDATAQIADVEFYGKQSN